jgi:hypothetical protein
MTRSRTRARSRNRQVGAFLGPRISDELRRQYCGLVPAAGVYVGRILKGEKPAEPAGRTTNQVRADHHQGARPYVPDKLLVAADEVIE